MAEWEQKLAKDSDGAIMPIAAGTGAILATQPYFALGEANFPDRGSVPMVLQVL